MTYNFVEKPQKSVSFAESSLLLQWLPEKKFISHAEFGIYLLILTILYLFSKLRWKALFWARQLAWERYQIVYLSLFLLISKNARSDIAIFKKSQSLIFSEICNISCINGKASLFSTKLYLGVGFYHFLKFWKKYTTLALFLKVCLTQKRTETIYTLAK